jgi:hypothetical protein
MITSHRSDFGTMAAMKHHKSSLKHTLRNMLLILTFSFSTSYANAQTGRQVIISEPDTSNFPEMVLYFDAVNRAGEKIIDLTQDQLSLKENNIERDITNFQALTPGIQLVTAINISPPFAIQDINGNSRFDFIKDGLLNWSDQPLNTSPDDLSLITNDGIELTHQSDRDEFRSTLEEYVPDLKETEANFNVLARAIEIASDPVSQPGMKKVVLFISSQPTTETETGLESLLALAQENQVQIYTIMVSSPAFFSSSSATRLQNLSVESGGRLYPFSGEEPLVDLGLVLNPLRSTYLIEYQSQIVTSGTQTLDLSISTTLGENSGIKEFFLEVLPPNPIFISPPREIVRKIQDEDQTNQIAVFEPETITLDVLLDFPDQHPRSIEELILRVDGEIVERKVSPPFDQFEWDISIYQTTGTHLLTLEAVDLLGLSRKSIETPITINVEIPPPDLGTIVSNNALPLVGLMLLIMLGLLLFVFISRGRITPADPLNENPFRERLKSIRYHPTIRKVLTVRPSRIDKESVNDEHHFIPYRIIPINDISQTQFPEPLRITDKEIIFGNDPHITGIHIQHHSVTKEHAKIDLNRNSKHQIRDLGSKVGTWINYERLSKSRSKLLKDGDIINIGEAGFRFQLIINTMTESS